MKCRADVNDRRGQFPTHVAAFDAVRVFALFGGIALHATVSLLPSRGGAIWPIADATSSRELAVVFYVIHTFRMVTFFLLAGFFARRLVTRDGIARFAQNRVKRILCTVRRRVGGTVPSDVCGVRVGAGALDRRASPGTGPVDHAPLVPGHPDLVLFRSPGGALGVVAITRQCRHSALG